MLKKIVVTALLLLLGGLTVQIARAVPAAPSPTCEITATITSVKKKTSNFKTEQPSSESFDYYGVRLKIISSSLYAKDGNGLCEDLAKLETDSIVVPDEYEKTPLKAGQKIKARMHFGGDERLGGYFLTKIEVLSAGVATDEEDSGSSIKSSDEISNMLVEKNELKTVETIELDSEKQQYSVVGWRNAKLFFFIPVSVRLEIKINAADGSIQSIKKPWWNFLAR
ncbi:MAG: hypothetical protein WC641_07085 [Patescibacteria group bacterium]